MNPHHIVLLFIIFLHELTKRSARQRSEVVNAQLTALGFVGGVWTVRNEVTDLRAVLGAGMLRRRGVVLRSLVSCVNKMTNDQLLYIGYFNIGPIGLN